MRDYQKLKLYRDALKAISKELYGIEPCDMSTAEKHIWAIVQEAREKAGWQ